MEVKHSSRSILLLMVTCSIHLLVQHIIKHYNLIYLKLVYIVEVYSRMVIFHLCNTTLSQITIIITNSCTYCSVPCWWLTVKPWYHIIDIYYLGNYPTRGTFSVFFCPKYCKREEYWGINIMLHIVSLYLPLTAQESTYIVYFAKKR